MKLSTIDRKKFRVRKKLKKVSKSDRFRLSVFRSAKNISAQIEIMSRFYQFLLLKKILKLLIKKIKLNYQKLLLKNLQKKHKQKKLLKFI